MNIKKERFS